MWLLCNAVHYISDKALYFVSHEHQVQVTLFDWSYMQKYMHFYWDSQPLSIIIIESVDDSDSLFKNKPAQRSPNEPKEPKI